MTLPAPKLDDRLFQDIVDEAKRLIPRYCPEWTDHNVSDPGVALIELFAWMSEMILYRLNQVPDAMYVRFLELMGIRLYPPAPARTALTFWLSAPQPAPVVVPAGTRVGTIRTEHEESIIFSTERDLTIVQPELMACLTATEDGRYEDHWDDLRAPNREVTCFPTPTPGDSLYLGFAEALGGNSIRLDVTARIEGVGVDPHRPPWEWETWNGESWEAVRVHEDITGGFNRDGAVTLLLPDEHKALTVGPTRAHWLRCRVVQAAVDQPPYSESPRVRTMTATGLGGTVAAGHSRSIPRERLGISKGTADQTFRVRHAPVVDRRADEHVVVVTGDTEEEWSEVDDFADASPDDRVYVWDGVTGTIRFGPRVILSDGTFHSYGAVPPPEAKISVTGYRTGGGSAGNVGPVTLTVLKTSLPFVSRVENLEPASGGVDAEALDNAKIRGPLTLRAGQRGVTAGDFETLTSRASPEVARARCLPPAEPGGPIRVLVVPRREVDPVRLELDDLAIPDPLHEAIAGFLDGRRTIGSSIEIATPAYQGVTVVARLRGTDAVPSDLLRDRALQLLYGYINPLEGGPEGFGWPFDRGLTIGELFALLAGIEGVIGVEDVRIFLADLRTGERSQQVQRAALGDDALFMSYQHTVVIA